MSETSIEILIILHAILRDAHPSAPEGMLRARLPAGRRVGDLLEELSLPRMEVVYAVNALIAPGEQELHDGDRVDIIPAISGGGAWNLPA